MHERTIAGVLGVDQPGGGAGSPFRYMRFGHIDAIGDFKQNLQHGAREDGNFFVVTWKRAERKS